MSFLEISPFELTCAPMALVGRQKMLLCATDARGTNAMTIAWGGFGVMWGLPTVFFAIRPSRYTYTFAEGGDSFSLCVLPQGYEGALAYCGTHSGREGDKLTAAGLTRAALPHGGFGIAEAELIITAKKLYSHPIAPSGLADPGIIDQWYAKEDIHKFYLAAIEKIYEKK